MTHLHRPLHPIGSVRHGLAAAVLAIASLASSHLAEAADLDAPVPLLATGQPVDWWFVFKFNAKDFPGCGEPTEPRVCLFDGRISPPTYRGGFGQQYLYASSAESTLTKGRGCAGETAADPLGATYGSIFDGLYYYVVWNDQPKGHPSITGCSEGGDCDAPWGHSKGLLAWNDAGEGMILQVTTPSWPLSASKNFPRQGESNTLGCIEEDDNVKLSQHFFALRLSRDDLINVLKALRNASVGTDPNQLQLVNNGGPDDVKELVAQLGHKVESTVATGALLSSGVVLISKPSDLSVPPWQMVSAMLGGVPLRTATFWNAPKIPTTAEASTVDCWESWLGKPGPVEIALSGQWDGTTIELASGGNHAKLGVSLDDGRPLVIFGDENQQGSLSGKCDRSQNGRGGLFFVLTDKVLAEGVGALLKGQTAPVDQMESAEQ